MFNLRLKEIPVRQKSIVLTGFMGVGKTTIGELVAEKLYRSFVDIDQEIEKHFNMSTTEIFNVHGEVVFRAHERKMIESFCSERLKIISIGGGAFMQPEVREVCLKNCTVLFLDMSWDKWLERFDILVDSRPILQSRNIDDIEKLFYERQETYAHNHSTLRLDDLSAEEASDQIVASLKSAWDLYEPN